MENNNIHNENISAVSEVKKQTMNKKVILFISLSILIPVITERLGIALFAGFLPDLTMQDTFSVLSSFFSAVCTVIGLVLILIFTSKLTKNKTEAIHFLGVYAMGKSLGAIVQSILSFILEIFFPTIKTSPSVLFFIQLAVLLAGSVASIIFAYNLYNRLIENNTVNPVSAADYSKIKKNMIFAYICVILASAALTSVISIIPVLESAGIAPENLTRSNFVAVLSGIIGTISIIAAFAILYAFGYKQRKNREDALNFAVCYYFPAIFTVVVTSILGALISLVSTNIENIVSFAGILISGITGASSLTMMVAEIVLVFYALRHLFPVQQITAVPFHAEETYTDDFYVEPSHIENAEIHKIDIEKTSNDFSQEKSE